MELTDITIFSIRMLLATVRVGGIFLVAPVFGHSAVPVKLRLAMAVGMALAVVGQLSVPAALPTNLPQLLLAACAELGIGLVIGYAARLLFTGIRLAAFHVGQQMGLTLRDVFDPAAEESGGGLRAIFSLLAVVIFLTIGGHRDLLTALLGTFRTFPSPATFAGQAMLSAVVAVLSMSFVLALKVAAPVLITMLLATVALALLQKTLPQCNLLSTHLPIRALVGLVALAASLAVLRPILAVSVEYLVDQISALPVHGI